MQSKNSIPVSEIQKQFWLLDQQGNDSAYHVVSAFRTEGLDQDRFVYAVSSAVAGLPVLNACIDLIDEQLVQSVNQSASLPIQHFTVDDESAALSKLKSISYEPFDLSNGQLVRLAIVQVADSEIAFVSIVVHHIAFDLRSKEVFAALIESEYNQSSEFPDCLDNYFQYPEWQQTWLQSTAAERARAYWREAIDKLTPELVMPEKADSDQYHEITFSLPDQLSSALRSYCDDHKTDPFIVVLSLYYWLLARFSGQQNFAVAVPLSNRKQDQFKKTIGCFVNTLPVRIDLSSVETASDLIRSMRRALLGAHRHQELPLTEIIKLNSEANAARQLFNAGYTFEQPMQIQLQGATVSPLVIPAKEGQLDCFMRLWNDGGALCGRLETNLGLWTENLAARFLRSLERLIESLTENPNADIGDLCYLSRDDVAIIGQFNHTQQDVLRGENWKEQTLLSLFSKQVAHSPDATALIDGRGSVTYQELDQRSTAVAVHLIEQGVKPGDVVAIKMHRSVDMVVAIYGIIKSGAAYLPIDVSLPPSRIQQILTQAGARLCVIETATGQPEYDGCTLLLLASASQATSNQTELPLVTPDHAAYVLFTSGSTGIPKGVVNTHHNIVNRLLWMQDYFKAQIGERVLQKTPYSFDVSVWELFWPLQNGATLVLPDHDSHKDPYQVLNQLSEYDIAYVHFVPSMLSAFLETADQMPFSELKQLKAVICSGEELTVALQNKFLNLLPGIGLYNLYGPTEAAIDVSCWKCDGGKRKQIPIGAPVANTQLYVVDDRDGMCPVGVVGELLIGGEQVANGYINDEEMTSRSFTSVPFAQGRVYRTGDYARWTDEGVLEYLGRKDFQVKLNGVRIELGEIENVVARIDKICLTAVVVHKTENVQRLIAYYSTDDESDIDQDILRAHLAQSLPTYMIPSQFIRLDVFPLSVSGKISRSSLPLPALQENRDRATLHREACSPTESRIAELWCALLERKDVGLNASFFELGGDSMLLMKMYRALNSMFSMQLKSVDVFRFTTIKSLAQYIDGNCPKPADRHGNDRAVQIRKALGGSARKPRTPMR